jgi:hypothetical protein
MAGVAVYRCYVGARLLPIGIQIFGSGHAAVTIQTPTHTELAVLINFIHGCYVAVAGFALHSPLYVAIMRKINVVGHIVNLDPLKGAVLSIQLFKFLNVGAVGLHNQVAVHAHVHRRHIGVLGFFNGRMTVHTLDFVSASMQFVAKRDGLVRGIAYVVTQSE